jgi:hypothetical protein
MARFENQIMEAQIGRACSHRSRGGTPAPDSDGRSPGRCGCPTGAHRRLLSEYRPAAPAEESSSLTTANSRACRGYSKDQPRSQPSTVRLLQPLPGSQTSRLGMSNGFASSAGSSRCQMASVGPGPRRLHAGCHSGRLQGSPELIPEEGSSLNPLSTLHRRFACARLSQPRPPRPCLDVDCNAHHHRS